MMNRVVVAALAVVAVACGESVQSDTTGAGGTAGVGGAGGTPPTAAQCLEEHHYPIAIDYDQFEPVIGSHCKGTNHQDVSEVEKVVFLGDSITEGTPPSTSPEFYRTLLGAELAERFAGAEVVECAANGARVADLLGSQIPECFPAPEPKRTLVVMTMGGNDVAQWPQDGLTVDEAMASADEVAAELRNAINWFYDDPSRFPNGVFVTFANVYEFTDSTGDLESCPGASIIGFSGSYAEGAAALAHLEEKYMEVAVDTGTDMLFMLEEFCGHGWRRETTNSCYLGPDAALWFDFTCIHPNPTGHAQIASMFSLVTEE